MQLALWEAFKEENNSLKIDPKSSQKEACRNDRALGSAFLGG
jgi:hypothetical protein